MVYYICINEPPFYCTETRFGRDLCRRRSDRDRSDAVGMDLSVRPDIQTRRRLSCGGFLHAGKRFTASDIFSAMSGFSFCFLRKHVL
jgi:hypothetical protein